MSCVHVGLASRVCLSLDVSMTRSLRLRESVGDRIVASRLILLAADPSRWTSSSASGAVAGVVRARGGRRAAGTTSFERLFGSLYRVSQ